MLAEPEKKFYSYDDHLAVFLVFLPYLRGGFFIVNNVAIY